MKLKVACLQLNPIIGQVESNINKVKQLLKKINQIDLILLPELALTGYNFASRESILPYLETNTNGHSINLAKDISKKFKCFTLIGYPEIEGDLIYNSAILVSPNGSILYNYRKTFLYETDKVWGCNENPEKEFRSIELVLDKEYYLNPVKGKKYQTITTNIGICMDLNPYEFTAPFNKFEMSLACFENKSKLILCPMAWLSPKSPSINDSLDYNDKLRKGQALKDKYFQNTEVSHNLEASESDYLLHTVTTKEHEVLLPNQPDSSTVHYWILRFFPFLNHPNNPFDKYYKKVTLITCNRVGIESDVLYGGSSSIIQFKNVTGNNEIDTRNPSVDGLGSLGQAEEGVLLREIDVETD